MHAATVTPHALGYQSELEQILAAPPPRLLCVTGVLAAGLVVAMVTIAACVSTDIVVVGSGTLAADSPTIALQAMERGVVHELRVQPGQHVRRGQVIATLDPTFTQTDLDTLDRQLRDADAKITRLQAELSPAPPAILPEAGDAPAMQAKLFSGRQQEYRLRLAGYDQALARNSAGLHAARQAMQSAVQSLAVATDIADMRRQLLRSQTGSRLLYLQAEDGRIQAMRNLDDASAQATSLSHALDATTAERQGFVAQWHRAALDDLISATADQARLHDQLAKAARLHELIRFAAPRDCTVLAVASRAPGSVLQPGEQLVSLMPDDGGMIAEISVASADIGHVAKGNPVVVKVDAFPYQQHGTLHGMVQSVSEQSFHPPGEAATHLVRVKLMPGDLAVIPGMTVSAEVRAGTRNLLGYFLYPVTRGLRESFREP